VAGETCLPGEARGVGCGDQLGVAHRTKFCAHLGGEHWWLLRSVMLQSRLVVAGSPAIGADHGFTT